LQKNIHKTIDFYNDQVKTIDKLRISFKEDELLNNLIHDSTQFAWDRSSKKDVLNLKRYEFSKDSLCIGLYRPFIKQNLYFNRQLNNYVSLLPDLFPTQNHDNLLICVSGIGVTKEFSCIISNIIPDIQLQFNGQCFPRYYYEEDTKKNTLFKSGQAINGYIRHDAVTDYIYQECGKKYGQKVSKDDIFYYVYGLLHSEDYRREFSADLKKMLPRIPLVDGYEDFKAFSKAGRDLAKIHLNYETAKPYGKVKIAGEEKGNFHVEKIRFISKEDKTVIQYNNSIKISEIPLEAYDYVVNGRSPIEWILDRYQVKTDPDSGIKNDPNDWAKEQGEPRYILDLILKVITVSLETMKIVKGLPKLTF
jgi:predicted helicase